MTRLEFLMDTVIFYGKDPVNRRSVSHEGYCCYKVNGKCCAIGRFIPDDKYLPSMEGQTIEDNDEHLLNSIPENILGLGINFLSDVQRLHDLETNWNDSGGLSIKGEMLVQRIIEDYCQD